MSDYSSLPVREDTKATLSELKQESESWDALLQRLAERGETSEGYEFAPSPANPNPGTPFEDYCPEDSAAALQHLADAQNTELAERINELESRLDDFETTAPRKIANELGSQLRS